MKIVLQKVLKGKFIHEDNVHSKIGNGIVIFVGISDEDSYETLEWMSNKILKLKLYEDWKKNVVDMNFEILVLSQFTIFAKFKGNKPSFHAAARPKKAEILFEQFFDVLSSKYSLKKVKSGLFGKQAKVEIVNDGPFTAILEK